MGVRMESDWQVEREGTGGAGERHGLGRRAETGLGAWTSRRD